jgi:hypothetical protein
MKKIARGIAGILLLGFGAAALSYGCGVIISQRAYLNRGFWQPFANFMTQAVRHWRSREPDLRPFAGYPGSTDASMPVVKARTDFRLLDRASDALYDSDEALEMLPFDTVRRTIERVRRQNGLSSDEKDELELMAAKVDLREGFVGDKERMLSAQSRLRAFLQRATTSPFRSEARGWLACACYHLGQYSEAAKIYLDEFKAPDSNVNSQSLANSLRLVINKAKPTLAAHIGEYFDTPEHALFIIQFVSDPMIIQGSDAQLMEQNGNIILKEMEKHRQLFAKKEDAEKLALAMMRVSLAMGDMGRLLQYAGEMPGASKTGQSPDYYWLVGCAHFLNHNYAAAEPPLRKMLKAPNASLLRQGKAAMALIGVYERLHRPLDELDVALRWQEIRRHHNQITNTIEKAGEKNTEAMHERYFPDEPFGNYVIEFDPLMPFPYTDLVFDIATLLDSELTVEQLQHYCDAHPDADPLVPYSLAVRYARQEKYDSAARFYAQAGAKGRHQRMLELQALYAATQPPSRMPEEVQQARLAYARFLSGHSCGVFFNDRLWHWFQTSSFLSDKAITEEDADFSEDLKTSGLPGPERDRIIRQQRRLQDEQEEYWQAYKIFNGIVKSVGPTSLGRQAAIEAIRCLDRISPRFGREEEIKAETSRLVKWLKSHKAA